MKVFKYFQILYTFEYFCLMQKTNFGFFFFNLQGNTRFLNNPLSLACHFLNRPSTHVPSLRSLHLFSLSGTFSLDILIAFPPHESIYRLSCRDRPPFKINKPPTIMTIFIPLRFFFFYHIYWYLTFKFHIYLMFTHSQHLLTKM